MQKDLNICLNTANKIDAALPITTLVNQYYEELQNQGNGSLDTSSLLLRLNKLR